MSKQFRNHLLALAGSTATIRNYEEQEWKSITFSGSRQNITLAFTDIAAADAFVEALEDAEFKLVGELVADAKVIAADAITAINHSTVTVEALVLTDK